MNMQQAIQLVGQKFNEEQQGTSDSPIADQYAEAFEKFPVVMEIATQFIGDQIIQQQYEARKKAMAAQAEGGGTPGGEGGAPPIQA